MTDSDTLEDLIRMEDAGDCVDDQITMAYWFYENDVTAPKDREKRTAEISESLAGRLSHEPETVLDNLVTIGVLEQVSTSGSDTYIRHHRLEEYFRSPEEDGFLEHLTEEVTRLLLDIREQDRTRRLPAADGGSVEDVPTLRKVVADAIDATPDDVVYGLTGTLEYIADVPELEEDDDIEFDDSVTRMNNFDKAVKAIEDHDVVFRGRNYEPMGFRNEPNRYTLTQRAVATEENHSMSDFS